MFDSIKHISDTNIIYGLVYAIQNLFCDPKKATMDLHLIGQLHYFETSIAYISAQVQIWFVYLKCLAEKLEAMVHETVYSIICLCVR